ncbi:hypothetical protein Tco_1027588, partial [Tanacetum coccineum]
MSMSNVHQQYLADAGSETRPLMLERGPLLSAVGLVACFEISHGSSRGDTWHSNHEVRGTVHRAGPRFKKWRLKDNHWCT